MAGTIDTHMPIAPTSEDAELADKASSCLSRLLAAEQQRPLHMLVSPGTDSTVALMVPVSALRLLNEILSEMSKGRAVTLLPVDAELTTTQAADILKVSRPFLIEQLEQGLLPYRKVGSHRRLKLQDVLAYKQGMERKRRALLEDLSAIDQELGLGY